jgi:methylmalonyl-CoA mutase
VTSLPFDVEVGEPGELGRRMARNTQLLLGEESGVGRVVDPAGGSWYVETLTDELATAAWDLFRVLEGAGGLPAVLLDGTLATRIAAVRDDRFAAVARRKVPLTGVSEFPDIHEEPLDATPWGSPRAVAVAPTDHVTTCDPLPRIRWAEQFEALRDAADVTADATGSRPSVFLANLGPVATHTARASFAKNFFEAGGIAAVTSEAGATTGLDADSAATGFAASGARLTCICSSDDVYAEQAAGVAESLKAAGAQRVYLAGNPGDRRDELTAAGVDEFVHVGVDVLATLRTAHEVLGTEVPEVAR